ncbi:PilZ domain-containing protein [Vibrio albus]|uniref:PilZ domain-containing protein n=1 Tax=Vibrio albus TaxID=2200953 RepID=A0A2U3B9V1_9VIBR|nr:PilZ domain-containing protein [Vibrio albus]PWI33586.1 PilZ domain-containing protein [Vibrio albus]
MILFQLIQKVSKQRKSMSDIASPEQQRRQFYRLRYPRKEDRPRAALHNHAYPICEISEGGARLLFLQKQTVVKGMILSGSCRFADGEEIILEGTTLRQDGNELVVKLSKGPSLKRMTMEQRHLRRKYPGIFSNRKFSTYAGS